MKNKKGFALKDFLVIILVFSIITLITTLTICIIVKENRKNSFKTGLQNVIASVETKCLMEQLKMDLGLKCPHGRPIAVKVSRNEIDKWFKRIV